MTLNPPLYRLQRLVKRYGSNVALSIDHLEIRRGSIMGLMGPNGSGKSTLLRILALIEFPSSGELYFESRKISPEDSKIRSRVTMLLQEPYLLRRSVFENVAYGLRVRGFPGDVQEPVREALSWVGLSLREFRNRSWSELSAGETQRVALASRLILRPQVLLLDEPTASVDSSSAFLIHQASLRARDEWGSTVLITSHDFSWLNDIADETITLAGGRVAGSGWQNTMAGPWIRAEQGMWYKMLPDGNRLAAEGTPHPEAVGAFEPELVNITLEPPNPAMGNHLRGIVTRLNYERSTRRILVFVRSGSLEVAARLPSSEVESLRLYPGGEVWCFLDPRLFRWLS